MTAVASAPRGPVPRIWVQSPAGYRWLVDMDDLCTVGAGLDAVAAALVALDGVAVREADLAWLGVDSVGVPVVEWCPGRVGRSARAWGPVPSRRKRLVATCAAASALAAGLWVMVAGLIVTRSVG